MNIVRTLTLRHLKENKSRTVVTILGIIVAVAMITAVFVGISSLLNVSSQLAKNTVGDYDFTAYVDDASIKKLKNDDRIKIVGIGSDSTEANNYETEAINHELVCSPSGNNNNDFVTAFNSGDKNYFKQFITSKYTGTLPENSKEIAVDKTYLQNCNLNWKIGDKVKLDFGSYYNKDEDYEIDYYDGEGTVYRKSSTRYVTVTAILNNNSQTYSIVTGLDNKTNEKNATVYVKLKKVGLNTKSKVESIIKDCGIDGDSVTYNGEYILYQGDITFSTQLADMLPLIITVLIIIIIASVMLIYNAFSMSLTSRVRYLGMLASVGATRKQKRNSVYFEGAFLGMIAIPLGILFGTIGIDITLNVVIDRLISTGALNGVKDNCVDSILSIPVWSIVGIIIFSIITIFISAYIPARKSSKISPIDAIRQNDSIKLKPRSLKSSKLIRKVFGYEGEIANKNLKRNGKKSRLIIFSITISIILFLSVNTFCNLFSTGNDLNKSSYQVQVATSYDKLDSFKKDLSNIKNIDDTYMINMDTFSFDKEESKDFFGYITSSYQSKYKDNITINMHIIDDKSFNEICKNNGIDKNNYYNTKITKMLMVNSVGDKSVDNPVLNDSVKNKKLNIWSWSSITDTMIDYTDLNDHFITNAEIGDFVKYDKENTLFKLDDNDCLTAFVPLSQYVKCINLSKDNTQIVFGIVTQEHKQVTEDIQNNIQNSENKEDMLFVNDVEADTDTRNAVVFTVKVFFYGFITLITLITIFNIINTISTGIAMRKREFAMLRSVGVSKKGFYKIVCLESLLYGVKSLIIGLPISFVISYAMTKTLGSSAYPFQFDYMMYIAVILAVFIIVGLSMLYAVSKIRKGSIIDAIKEDLN